MASNDVSAAIAATEKLLASLKAYDGSSSAHLTLLNETDRVRAELEQPYDVVTRLYEHLSVCGALNMLLRIGAMHKLPSDGTSIKAADLATAVNVDVTAIHRAMRVIIVQGIAAETGPDEYTHNQLSQSLLPEAAGAFFLLCMDLSKSMGTLPEYFKSHKPEDLYDLTKSPFAYSVGKEGRSYYEVLNDDVDQRNIWNAALQMAEKNMPVRGMFPWVSLKEQVEKEPERAFVVDIGGGRGQSLLAIQDECSGTFGSKLILQDLPIVIDSLKPEEIPNIDATVHDLFTPQPVKNAHVYFYRRLLHDFYNPVCVEILKQTVSAMGPDSRLIVCDMLVPSRVTVGVPMQLYWLDLSLMLISGKEKTIEEFHEIFEAVGLELVKIYPSNVGETVMLETRLKRTE
ncbi:hypothetical protein V495_06967 [Pseudogymnoascus sp. VKM F-4514 (FW-929)]|nr:hypothetical protein V490_08974 [Pseudogymnoascus sp. VKM F-3557]KFY37765.1 hypothetical protein V495_06967 [Pseudogymnoascus sp. VKM F-4514 (FW-929)]KFY58242.1 hypothetical protein V497_04959 [Pseudogymnoascus sp. VKM F-4516 (FW-969)]